MVVRGCGNGGTQVGVRDGLSVGERLLNRVDLILDLISRCEWG
jgi:hypothetical protein